MLNFPRANMFISAVIDKTRQKYKKDYELQIKFSKDWVVDFQS